MKVKELLALCINYDEEKSQFMLENPATGRWKSYDKFTEIPPKVLEIEIEYFGFTSQYKILVAYTANDNF